MKFSKKFFFISLLVFSVGFISSVIVSYTQKEMQAQAEEKKRQEMYTKILSGTNIQPETVTINFNQTSKQLSPLIFGGSHTPPLEHEDAWVKLKETGITSLRKDLYIEFTTPSGISIDQYKNNIGDIQNVKNWDTSGMNRIKYAFSKIKKNDMQTIGIISYAPAWLTYNHTPFGVPKDWNVYKDIVKKQYREYRDLLDYVEIWNEPDHKTFLVTDGSPYTKSEAYKNIYYYASNAIREVDNEIDDGKKTPIGAAVESNPTVGNILSDLLSDPKTNIKPDFISFHTYDSSYSKFLNVYIQDRKKYLNPATPIFITEWNRDSAFEDVSEYKTGNKAILFTANRFLDFIKDDITAASYFAMLPINTTNRQTNEDTMGFYRWTNGQAELLPQSRTWKLMSVQMGLGKGKSLVYNIDNQSDVKSVGFKNSLNQHGIILINNKNSQMSNIIFENTKIKNFAKVSIYYASAENDATVPVYKGLIKSANNKVNLNVYLPKETIVGVLVEEDKEWFDFLNLPY